jgi:hypothetical protein
LIPDLVEGCGSNEGDGICAVVDNFMRSTQTKTYAHFMDLTNQIDLMYQNRLFHGDLQAANILFLCCSKVLLVDFEWAGIVSKAQFPPSISSSSFAKVASQALGPGSFIDADFDWICLADLLDKIECPYGTKCAKGHEKDKVIAALSCMQQADQGEKLLNQQVASQDPITPFPNLQSLGCRLARFYLKHITARKQAEPAGGSKRRRR